jgi:hypothetical protein
MTVIVLLIVGYLVAVACYLAMAFRAAARRRQRGLRARDEGDLVYESWALEPDEGQVPAFNAAPKLHPSQSAEQWSGGYRTASV